MKTKFTILLLLLLIFSCTTENKKNNNKKLNVLFIVADDLNCAIGAYGDDQALTPNIDKLARRGLLFTDAHNQYPHCGPSRASFMTGLYPDQTKSKQLRLYIRQTIPDVVTLGQKFRSENYQSVRVGKIYHYHNPRDIGTAGHDDPFTWDRTFNPWGRDKKEENKINTLMAGEYGGTLSWLEADGRDEEQTDGIGANETIDLLDEFAKTGENFFLAYGLFRPHVPFVAPKKYYDMFDEKDFTIPFSDEEYLKTIPMPAARSVREKKVQNYLEKNLAKTIKEAYYATTSFVDAQIGRVLDKLEETGLDKNTIVILTSDHGYHLGEHGHWQKRTLFNHATRVPLIFSGPGINNENGNVDDPVELVDLYPTIMDLLSMNPPDFLSGKSLKPYLEGNRDQIRKNALTELRVWTPTGIAQGYSLKTKDYRFTKWLHNDNLDFELYDLNYDSSELNNLANDNAYKNVKDSLLLTINNRIFEANKYPESLGRQIENATPLN